MNKFYEFTQNNSGGRFVINKKLCHRLLIEANSKKEAEDKAFDMGVYYDGCDQGLDCNCCGDRWYSPEEIKFPYRYGCLDKDEAEKLSKKYKIEYKKTTNKFYKDKYDIIFDSIEKYTKYVSHKFSSWTKPDARIFYKNGKVKEIN